MNLSNEAQLQTKLAITVACITLSFLAAISYFNFNSTKSIIIEQTNHKLELAAELTAKEISDNLVTAKRNIDAWSNLSALQEDNENNKKSLNGIFSILTATYDQYDSIAYFNIQGELISSSKPLYLTNDSNSIQNSIWFKTALKKKNSIYISSPFYEKLLSSEVIAASKLITNSKGKGLGVLVTFLNWSELYELTNNSLVFDKNTFAMIIDQNILDDRPIDNKPMIIAGPNFLLSDSIKPDDVNLFNQSILEKLLDKDFKLIKANQNTNKQLLVKHSISKSVSDFSQKQWTILAIENLKNQRKPFELSPLTPSIISLIISPLLIITLVLAIKTITKSASQSIKNTNYSIDNRTIISSSTGSKDESLLLKPDEIKNKLEADISKESFIDSITESMINALLLVNDQGIIKKANRNSCSLLKLENNILLGKSIKDIIIIKSTLKTINRIIKERLTLHNQIGEMITADNHRVPILLSSCPVSNGDIAFLAYDMSLTKQLLDEVNNARLISESIVKAIPSALATISHQLIITSTNKKFNYIFGNDFCGKNLNEVIDNNILLESIIKAENTDNIIEGLTIEYSTKGKNTKFLSITIAPIKNINTIPLTNSNLSHLLLDSPENLAKYVIIIDDITQKSQDEKNKLKLEERLRQSQKMETVGILAGGIAHQMNNVLAPILGFTDIVLHNLSNDDKNKPLLEQVIDSTNQAKNIVNKILSIGKLESNFTPMHLNAEISRVSQLVKSNAPKNINIQLNICDKDYFVLGNLEQLEQATMNLLTNACDAIGDSADGEIKISLTIESLGVTNEKERDLFYCISIKDNGDGIEEDVVEHIFEPFFTTKDISKGTGLGLSVTHRIIKAHNGFIDVKTKLNEGTEFKIYLPRHLDQELEAKNTVTTKSDNKQYLPKGTEHILLVDDENMIIEMAESMLSGLGYKITKTSNSRYALSLFKRNPKDYDLVITDYIMPAMNGAELAQEMLDIEPKLPIILMTGYSGDFTERTCLELGIRSRLTKPVAISQLSQAVRNALDTPH